MIGNISNGFLFAEMGNTNWPNAYYDVIDGIIWLIDEIFSQFFAQIPQLVLEFNAIG